MGTFTVQATISHPHEPSRCQELFLLVDTGAAYTVIPQPLLEALGVHPTAKRTVTLADGREEVWDLTYVLISLAGEQAPTPCLMAPHDGMTLLGAVTLEQFGLGVDPLGKTLIPVRAPLACTCLSPRLCLSAHPEGTQGSGEPGWAPRNSRDPRHRGPLASGPPWRGCPEQPNSRTPLQGAACCAT
ncbi:MAG: retroviral-like aspartic protease family protein [candidate division NC10 bacterium]|nr:retroviral-like aspartic protease family protein [candidate division NC10 bacterium]